MKKFIILASLGIAVFSLAPYHTVAVPISPTKASKALNPDELLGGYHHRHPLLFYLRRHPLLLFYLRRSPLRRSPLRRSPLRRPPLRLGFPRQVPLGCCCC